MRILRCGVLIATALLAPCILPLNGASAADWPAVVDLVRLEGTKGFVIRGIDPDDRSGTACAGIGDLNGDGLADVFIGADGADPDGRDAAGECYVVFGTVEGVNNFFDLDDLDGTNGFVIRGVGSGDRAGFAVDPAGDVNADGIGDLLVGAWLADPAGASSGEAYVIFGSSTGYPAILELSSLDGTNGFTMLGVAPSDYTGYDVSPAGDLNADGIDDVAVGAYAAWPGGQERAGHTYIVYGSDTGFPAFLDLATLDGTNGFLLRGIDALDWSGESIDSAGDVNADGIDDLIIGADGADPGGIDRAGESYVIFGSASGFPATVELSALDGTNGFVLNGSLTSEGSGECVAGIGDLNGDGIDDIAIGADREPSDPGRVYVVFGSDSPFPASVDLGSLDGTDGFLIESPVIGDKAGFRVSGADDVNGDGFDDLLIGAFLSSILGGNLGVCYVVFGHDSGFPALLNLGDLDGSGGFMVTTSDSARFLGYCATEAGDVNGDGFGDLLLGASGARSERGDTFIVYGKPGNTCFDGTIDAANSSPKDVLFVNGQRGAARRLVLVPDGGGVILTVVKPPSSGNGRFVLHGNLGAPSPGDVTVLPKNVGTSCWPFLITEGANPIVILNNIGRRALVGDSHIGGNPVDDPLPAPTGYSLGVLPLGTVLTFQGIIVDNGSVSNKDVSATNAIILEVVP